MPLQPRPITAAALALAGLLALLGPPALRARAEEVPTIVPRPTTEGPIEVSAFALEEEPTVDGRDREWEEVPEAVVPLWPTVERDPDNHLGPVDLRIKAGFFQDTLYLILNWPDPSPSATHRSWVWDFTVNRYRPGTDLEDRLAVRFGWGEGFSACLLTGGPHRADLWIWRAARSSPAGHAEDAVQVVSDAPLADGQPWRLPDGRARWLALRPDAGEELTYTRSFNRYMGDIVPQFIVKKAEKLTGSRKDVEAKGTWLEGFWTVELSRAFDTGHPDDIAFKRGSVHEMAISAANRGEGAHESVSPLIKLVIPPQEEKERQ